MEEGKEMNGPLVIKKIFENNSYIVSSIRKEPWEGAYFPYRCRAERFIRFLCSKKAKKCLK